MNPNPFIRPLPPMQRIDLYAKMFSDAYAILLNLHTDAHDDPCPLVVNEVIDESLPQTPSEDFIDENGSYLLRFLVIDESLPQTPSEDFIDENGSYLLRFLGIDESEPPSSSKGQITDNAETDTDVSTNLNHKDLDASFQTIKEEYICDHDSRESNNPSLNHNTQETKLVSGPYLYYWGPQDWLMHPSLYDKYMYRYLDMPFEFEVDSATSLPSLGPSYGVVNDVAPDLAEIVKQIEYYFSFDNLVNDVNFREHMVGEGWVPLPFVASLPEVRKLTSNVKVIVEALRTSFAIEMDGGKYIRPRHTWERDGFHPNHIEP